MKNKARIAAKATGTARKAISLAVSLSLIAAPLYPLTSNAGTVATTVAPNLMIILGNSYSMSREMDNIKLPKTPSGKELQNQCPANYSSTSDYQAVPSFANDPACGSAGTPFPDRQYGNQPTSKMYIAKQVLYELMQSSKSNQINFGLATFRQAFGLQNSVSTVLTNTFWPNIFPSNGTFDNPLPGTLSGKTTEYRNTYGQDPNNFSWVSWWPAYDNIEGAGFAIGKVETDGADQPDNSRVQSFSSTTNGLPLSVQYPKGQQSPYYENNQTQAQGGDYYYGSGGLDIGPPIYATPGTQPPKFKLCRTYYNSQDNAWQGEYVASNPNGSPRMVVNTYPNLYTPNTIQFIPIGSTQYNPDGSMDPQQWSDYCSTSQSNVKIKQQSNIVSDDMKDPVTGNVSKAYFSYIPSIYDTTSEAGIGAFTGWSGAATYNPSTNTYTASYPAGAQSASQMGSYNKSGAPVMGAFVDLPNPASGYIDQRAKIEGLINPAYPQWDDSGLGYDENAQTITNDGERQSISSSDYKPDYDPFQSPVYDSLMDAAAYFAAYKKQDADLDVCRTNRVLLIYDGHEDANYTKDSEGNITYADPAKAAAALKAIGVETNVVIISNNPGDIEQANAIAAAGGTGSAFQVKNASDLLNAVSSVFTGLQGTVTSASPAVPGQVKAGSLAYSEVSNNAFGSMTGHLYAYKIAADGTVGASPVFDAASPAFQANRGAKLWSDNPNNGVNQISAWSSLPDSVFAASGTPDATMVSAYTVDPNSYSGAYLAGRASGSYVGTMTSQSSDPVYVGAPSNPLLLSAPGYGSYAQANSSRSPAVLWSADDGFLYSSNATTGALNWAYMPSPLLPELKNYASFESTQPMSGGFGVVDGVGSDGAWHSFVYGTAKGGAIHYGIQLDSSGNPAVSVPVAVDNQAGSTSPGAAKPLVTWDSAGVAYGLYTTINGTTANLNVISSTGAVSSSKLPFVPSSPLAIDQSTGNIYVGATDGKVYTLNTNNGYTAADITGTYDKKTSLVGSMANTSDPANHVGFYQSGSGIYVWATGDKQISVFTVGDKGWQTDWTTAVNGPSTNLNPTDGSTVTYAADPGTTGTGPQFLPNTGVISDASLVLNGVMIVPVTTIPSGSVAECTAANASYYLYRMDNGAFPQGAFTDASGKSITNNIVIGAGIAFTPVVAYNSELGGYSIYGSAQQDSMGKSFAQLVANAKSNVRSGVIGLRPLMMTHP